MAYYKYYGIGKPRKQMQMEAAMELAKARQVRPHSKKGRREVINFKPIMALDY